ncbi:MAG TPA: ERF family protein [Moraxellaceae bacterium]|nr:ERF family protein [Moraxellaceae bacterium]
MQKSDQINELAAALAKAQGEIENASKNAANPHFKSKYADLAEVINTVRPVFAKHGLSVTQFPSFADGLASVETVLMHSSGQWMSGTASAGVTKMDAQGVGSAITYLRRYSLAAVAGIAQEDDDANAAVGGRPQKAHPGLPSDRAASQDMKPKDAKLISYDEALKALDCVGSHADLTKLQERIEASWKDYSNPQKTDLRQKKQEVVESLNKSEAA